MKIIRPRSQIYANRSPYLEAGRPKGKVVGKISSNTVGNYSSANVISLDVFLEDALLQIGIPIGPKKGVGWDMRYAHNPDLGEQLMDNLLAAMRKAGRVKEEDEDKTVVYTVQNLSSDDLKKIFKSVGLDWVKASKLVYYKQNSGNAGGAKVTYSGNLDVLHFRIVPDKWDSHIIDVKILLYENSFGSVNIISKDENFNWDGWRSDYEYEEADPEEYFSNEQIVKFNNAMHNYGYVVSVGTGYDGMDKIMINRVLFRDAVKVFKSVGLDFQKMTLVGYAKDSRIMIDRL